MNRALPFALLGLAVFAAAGCGGEGEKLTLNQWAAKLCTRIGAWERDMNVIVDPYLQTAGAGFTRSSVLNDVSKGRQAIQQLSADLKMLRPKEMDGVWRHAQGFVDGNTDYLSWTLSRLDRAERRLRHLPNDTSDASFARGMVAAEGELATVVAVAGLDSLPSHTSRDLEQVLRSVPACRADSG